MNLTRGEAPPTGDSPTTDSRMPRSVWWLMAVVAGLFASMAIVSPVLDRLVRQPFSGGNTEVSLFQIAHSLPMVLLGVVLGLWSDRIGRRHPLIVVGAVGTGITTVLTPHMTDFMALLGLRLLDGIFGALLVVALFARAADLCTASNRAMVMAVLGMSIPVGYLGGMALSAIFAGGSLAALFGIAGGMLVIMGVAFGAMQRGPEHVEPSAAGLAEMLGVIRRVPRLWLPISFGMVDKVSFAALAMLISLMLADRMGSAGAAEATTALGFALFWIAYLGASLPAARLTRRWGTLGVMGAASIIYGGFLAALGGGHPALIVIMMGFAGGACAFQTVPNLAMVSQMSSPQDRAVAMGAFHSSGSLGMLAGFAVLGIVTAEGAHAVGFWLVAGMEVVIGVAGLAMAARWGWSLRSQKSSEPIEMDPVDVV